MAPNKEETYSFNFDVDKQAPVGKEDVINFTITSSNKETWTKEIKVKASAPDKYELYQNYPNPFNPSTIISYQLPEDSKVTIKIYDILGREVATLLNNEEKKAGYYENNFSAGGGSSGNANALSSGVYIYRLSAKSNDGKSKEFNSIKKMMVIK
ncbi:MAG: T9SS type A sorting domain-containing protein [Ignavibacteriaceae bacterium]